MEQNAACEPASKKRTVKFKDDRNFIIRCFQGHGADTRIFATPVDPQIYTIQMLLAYTCCRFFSYGLHYKQVQYYTGSHARVIGSLLGELNVRHTSRGPGLPMFEIIGSTLVMWYDTDETVKDLVPAK